MTFELTRVGSGSDSGKQGPYHSVPFTLHDPHPRARLELTFWHG